MYVYLLIYQNYVLSMIIMIMNSFKNIREEILHVQKILPLPLNMRKTQF